MNKCLKAFVGLTLMIFVTGSYAGAKDVVETKGFGWKPSLENLVNIKAVEFHQKMLQKIADRNDGNRAAGTSGYEKSVQYMSFMLSLSGFDVTQQDFEFPFFQVVSDPEFEQTAPTPTVYPADGFATMTYSGSGNVTAPVEYVDVVLPPAPDPNTSNSGCEATDFDAFTAGNIALVQRGSCSFYDKAMNAQNAGAVAVIIFNEGQDGRQDAIVGTLGAPEFTIPVIFSSFAIGNELADAIDANGGPGAVQVRVKTDTLSEIRVTQNVIAESKSGDPANTVVLGGHLDSVLAGAGINDNGSGCATLLEAAMKLGWFHTKLTNKVVFAFWGAEELGLIGSEFYVNNLTPEELANIKLYLNFDMVASPNYVRFVFDGDGSDTGISGPPGSDFIEQWFVDFFGDKLLATDPTALDGRSDYEPFMLAGIPVGGLFTGAGDLKTEEQAAIYGGTAGEPYDKYYHTENDTSANINFEVEEQMLKAIAAAVQFFSENSLPAAAPSIQSFSTKAAKGYDLDFKGPLAVK
ncbi:MAG: M28 family peptidase [Proteobacteria bacterium]|nr:M28 family peptidase [Pseudomonadota bacterium]